MTTFAECTARGLQHVAKPHHVELLGPPHPHQYRPFTGKTVEVVDWHEFHEFAPELTVLQELLDRALELLIQGHRFPRNSGLAFQEGEDERVRLRFVRGGVQQPCLDMCSSPPRKTLCIVRGARPLTFRDAANKPSQPAGGMWC